MKTLICVSTNLLIFIVYVCLIYVLFVTGKTNQWRDSVSRSTASLAERMSSPKGSTMSGVLHENDSVHGHLKFHHHALW